MHDKIKSQLAAIERDRRVDVIDDVTDLNRCHQTILRASKLSVKRSRIAAIRQRFVSDTRRFGAMVGRAGMDRRRAM
jgi:hypothetical protein